MNFLILWILLGFLTNVYYFIKNHDEYNYKIINKEIKLKNLMLGFILTLFLFPISIYNNIKK